MNINRSLQPLDDNQSFKELNQLHDEAQFRISNPITPVNGVEAILIRNRQPDFLTVINQERERLEQVAKQEITS